MKLENKVSKCQKRRIYFLVIVRELRVVHKLDIIPPTLTMLPVVSGIPPALHMPREPIG